MNEINESMTAKVLGALRGEPPRKESPMRAWVEAHAGDIRDAMARGWSAAAIAKSMEKESGGALKASALRPLIQALARARKPAAPKAKPAPKAATTAAAPVPKPTAVPADRPVIPASTTVVPPKPTPATAPEAKPAAGGILGFGRK